jgi:hypothetical protein
LDRTKLKLGFFLLRNPSPIPVAGRYKLGKSNLTRGQFFNSSPWKEQNLDKNKIGIERLQSFLQDLLNSHI